MSLHTPPQMPSLQAFADVDDGDKEEEVNSDAEGRDSSVDSFRAAARAFARRGKAEVPLDTLYLGARHARRGSADEPQMRPSHQRASAGPARAGAVDNRSAALQLQAWKEDVRARHKAAFEQRVARAEFEPESRGVSK